MKKLSLAIVCLSYASIIHTSESPQNNKATFELLELCKSTIVDHDLLNGNFDNNTKIGNVGLDVRFKLYKHDDCLYINTFGEEYPGYPSPFFDWCKKKELFKNLQGNKLDDYTSKNEHAGECGIAVVRDIISLQTKIPSSIEDEKLLELAKKLEVMIIDYQSKEKK